MYLGNSATGQIMLTTGTKQLSEYIIVKTDRRPSSINRDVVMHVDRMNRGIYYSLEPIQG